MSKSLITATFIALTLGAANAATAHPGPIGDDRPDFASLDANGDGAVTQEEFTAPMRAHFAAADTDGSGGLSAEEMAAQASARMAERMARRMQRADANGDGELQFDEMRGRRDPAAMFERLDRDGNGTISEAELTKARDHGRHRDGGHHGDGHHGDGHHGGRD